MKLTRREREVAGLVAEGLTNRAIAQRLFIDERTVEDHVRHALGKLGFENRAQLAAWAARGGTDETEVRLPQPLTRFIGRSREVGEVRDLLLRRRLVTLTGPGGVGKTRLALAAADMSGRFGRVVMADLSAISSADRVLFEVAQAVTDGRGGDEASLVARLDDAASLLVLDNCEHLVAAAGELAEMLLRRTRVVILATSRAPLEVESEATYAVPPLSDEDAVELFMDRAQAGSASVAEAAEVCRRVDRLPLAVELAAARMRVMSASALAASLTESLAILSSGVPSAPGRSRSVEASVAWSYDQLGTAEQAALLALGVFEGSFELGASAKVAAVPETTVLGLVDRSLVARAPGDRYRLLYPIREFARGRLGAGGDRRAAEERHDAWAAEVVRSCSGAALDRDWAASRRLWKERDEIWAALERLADRDRSIFVDIAPLFALALPDFGVQTQEAVELSQRAVRLAQSADAGYARALLIAGAMLNAQGEPEAARSLVTTAYEAADAAGDDAIAARCLVILSNTYANVGETSRAIELLERSKARAGVLKPGNQALVLNAEAMLHWRTGQYQEGERTARRAVELLGAGGIALAPIADTLSLNLEGQGRYAEAAEVMRPAAAFVLSEDLAGQGVMVVVAFCRIYLGLGDEERAATLLGAVQRLVEQRPERASWIAPDGRKALARHPEAAARGRAMSWREALEFALE